MNLTLVDLPGINYAQAENSKKSASEVIKPLIEKYIKHEKTFIVIVVSAEGDVSNTEAVKLARDADPTMSRTMLVYTKVDIV